MRVQIYGASDDLIEIEGDIREEFAVNNTATARKFYVYCEGDLQMTFQIKFTDSGYWNVVPQIDIATWDEENKNYIKEWDIALKFNDQERCRYSTTLLIDSGNDVFEIERKRRK